MTVRKVHLAIYDKKNAGILSGALHLKPDQVIVLHRKGHDVTGLKSVLNSRGIKCQSQMVSFNPQQINTILTHIFDSNSSNNVIFNATTGPRLIVLLALKHFFNTSRSAFVVDQFTNQMSWLSPENKKSEILASQLKITEYLKLFSIAVTNKGDTRLESQQKQSLTYWLVDNIERFGRSLAALNHIAMHAEHSLRYNINRRDHIPKYLNRILTEFEQVGLLKRHHNEIVFKNEASRFYANGGWLENHVFNTLFHIKKSRDNINDMARGMEVSLVSGNVKNEIDVIAMVNNRLHLIECKTRKFTNKNHANTPGAAAIYRLDTLKESLGGRSGKAMLISYQKLSQYTEQRAQDLGIYCCSFNQLKQLKNHLFKFIDSTQ